MTTESGFGKYTILEKLGAGGMAEVFKCRLNGIGGFDKLVVVKRILPERMEEPEFVHMFLDEARIAANLNHPNVIHIFEVDELEGSPYMAMEYVQGPTLSALIRAAYRQHKLNVGHTAKVISGICAGLSYVHNAKAPNGVPLEIIHRDISPQNILISVEGTPKLLDFGVAKAAGRLAKTEAGTFKGKLRYTAPELLKGQPVDARTDVYSVGVCLYEATTGRARIANNLTEAQMVSIVMEGRMELPSNVMENYPPELERIVRWAVDPDPLQRCPSAQALHQALEQFVASGPHASSTQAVAKWVSELFPPAETQSYGRTPATTQTSGSNNSARQQLGSRAGAGASFIGQANHSDVRSYRANGSSSSGKLRTSQVPPQEESEQTTDALGAEQASTKPVMAALSAMGLLVGLLALGGGIAYVATRQTPKAPPPAAQVTAEAAPATPQPVLPQTPPLPTPSPLVAYLDEAERFLQQQQYSPAREMLAKAKEEQTQDAELVIRRTRLLLRAERESLLSKARMALQLNDVPGALEASKQVLDLEPTNADALALFAEARKLDAPAVSARTRQKVRTGTLDLTVEPGGMVYVNDEPLGLAPLSQYALPHGRHRLEVRLAGYIPLERVLRITASKHTSLALKLVPINPVSAPPQVVAEPGPQ
jgi:serine/threonine protein kinase